MIEQYLIDEIYTRGIVPYVKNYSPECMGGFLNVLRELNIRNLFLSANDINFDSVSSLNYENLNIGVIDISNEEDIDKALSIGSKFICINEVNHDLLKYLENKNICVFIRVKSELEIKDLYDYGYKFLVISSCDELGDFERLIEISKKYKDIKILIDLGINDKDIFKYLSINQIIACFGSFMIDKISLKNNKFENVKTFIEGVLRRAIVLDYDHKTSIYEGNIESNILIKVNNIFRGIKYYEDLGFILDDEKKEYENGYLKSVYFKDKVSLYRVKLVL